MEKDSNMRKKKISIWEWLVKQFFADLNTQQEGLLGLVVCSIEPRLSNKGGFSKGGFILYSLV